MVFRYLQGILTHLTDFRPFLTFVNFYQKIGFLAIFVLKTPNVSSELDNHLINKGLTIYKMKRKGATEQELRAYSMEMDKRAELQI